MNWEALGAVGDFVGGVVVLITLIYLSAQIRQNTRGTRAQATAAVASEMQRNLLAEDPIKKLVRSSYLR